ncbi:MAG: hypothetical protein ACJAVO_002308 [Parvibaculaceae bacterium]|jgi:hypothetical protein
MTFWGVGLGEGVSRCEVFCARYQQWAVVYDHATIILSTLPPHHDHSISTSPRTHVIAGLVPAIHLSSGMAYLVSAGLLFGKAKRAWKRDYCPCGFLDLRDKPEDDALGCGDEGGGCLGVYSFAGGTLVEARCPPATTIIPQTSSASRLPAPTSLPDLFRQSIFPQGWPVGCRGTVVW